MVSANLIALMKAYEPESMVNTEEVNVTLYFSPHRSMFFPSWYSLYLIIVYLFVCLFLGYLILKLHKD